FEESRRRVADLRVRLQEAESDREKYESQMDQISTAREYDALEKEIRDASDREQQFRRDLQREEKDLEEQRTRLEREETMIKTEEEELEQERAKIDSETADRKEMLIELGRSEDETIPGLDEELLFKFERIIKSKEGEGIVPIRNGVCTGCQLIVPYIFVNDVSQCHQILFCPYCSKIVFHTDDDADLEETGFSESDEESLLDLVDDEFDGDLFEEAELTDLSDEDELTPEEAAEYAGDDDVEETEESSDDDEDDLLDDESESEGDDDAETEDDFEEEEIDD
ncbi:MAG: nucleic acid-binding protein, partial [Spirochaeta sp.]|nr:nucleic acid-binding protein [Spirochaeta sp.]